METMSNDQLLELLKIGDIKGFNEYRKENPDQDIDFKRGDLSGGDLFEVKINPYQKDMLINALGITVE